MQKIFYLLINIVGIAANVPFVKSISNILSDIYSAKYLNPIVIDNKFINTEQNQSLSKDFRKTYMRYSMATNLIPAQFTLKQILNTIHRYIATGKLNETELLTHYLHLQNFAQMCSSTIAELANFVYNPSSVDLRNLCNILQDRINNIENLIDMYLSDELEKDSRSK